MGGALHGGGKTGVLRGGVGGQRPVHWKGGSSTTAVGAREVAGRKGVRFGVIKTTSF